VACCWAVTFYGTFAKVSLSLSKLPPKCANFKLKLKNSIFRALSCKRNKIIHVSHPSEWHMTHQIEGFEDKNVHTAQQHQ
jgi:hypothetical protein